jgi:putative flavoprotein involved in K+ transport
MQTTCVIIGAGHSGLAMSRCLSECSVDHVILERGEIANSWKQERWDSLRLLTPNWQTRLPGFAYQGDNPDGYMDMPEVIEFMQNYAEFISAPVEQNTSVTSVSHDDRYYQVVTDRGHWQCETLVIASGACNRANIPALAQQVPDGIEMLTPIQYRNPDQLRTGGVLVVGASATGLQLAEEIKRSGRAVTLAVGEHVRLPRTYRGKDIQYWLDALGILDETFEQIDDIVRGRNIPSPQLVGSSDRHDLDLNRLSEMGVKLRGRLAGINDGKAQFSGSLANVCEMADLKMNRLLNRIDEFVIDNELEGEVTEKKRFDKTTIEDSPPLLMDFSRQGIKTIVWATGYSADYSWLDLPVLDRKGKIRHQGGVVDSPGMYLMGTTLLRRRKSTFIHGAEDDARDLSTHLLTYLNDQSIQTKKCVGF